MPSGRNRPLDAQQPVQLYTNDPTGYWGAVAKQNATSGLASLLPVGTAQQVDLGVTGRLLSSQINWAPVQIRWRSVAFTASFNDGQMSLQLGNGGVTSEGVVTVLTDKAPFGNTFPAQRDNLEISVNGEWLLFTITEVAGAQNTSDNSLTLTCQLEYADES